MLQQSKDAAAEAHEEQSAISHGASKRRAPGRGCAERTPATSKEEHAAELRSARENLKVAHSERLRSGGEATLAAKLRTQMEAARLEASRSVQTALEQLRAALALNHERELESLREKLESDREAQIGITAKQGRSPARGKNALAAQACQRGCPARGPGRDAEAEQILEEQAALTRELEEQAQEDLRRAAKTSKPRKMQRKRHCGSCESSLCKSPMPVTRRRAGGGGASAKRLEDLRAMMSSSTQRAWTCTPRRKAQRTAALDDLAHHLAQTYDRELAALDAGLSGDDEQQRSALEQRFHAQLDEATSAALERSHQASGAGTLDL